MAKTYCPECDAVISVNDPREGANIKCPECGVELEIIATDPFEVDYPLDDDWDEEEEGDY
jgi:alpha-aminoadipate carrier protein LysW